MHRFEGSQSEKETVASGAVGVALAGAALLLIAAQWLMARLSPGWAQTELRTISDALPLVLLLAAPGLAGLMALPWLPRLAGDRRAFWLMLGTGLLMRLVWYGVPGAIDEDHIRYLWDGAVLAHGHSPYAFAPQAAIDGAGFPQALAPLAVRAREVLAGIGYPELVTIYPGTAQAAFALAHALAPFSLDGLRLVFLAAEAATLGILVAILRDLGRPPIMAALFWLNPLAVWASHGTGHTEALLAPLVLGALLAAWRDRNGLAALLLALAVGVKLWPVLLAPLLARLALSRGRGIVLPAAVFAGVAAALVLPLAFSAAAGQRSGILAYSEHWWVNNAPFAWISYGVLSATGGAPLGQWLLRGSLAAGTGILALWLARRPPATLNDLLCSALIVAAVTFYAAPAQFPWYAMWFLPLAAALECRALLAASVTLAVYYLSIPLASQGLGHLHSYGIAFLHALPVWGWLALKRTQGMGRSLRAT